MTDVELLQHLHISGRSFDPQANSFGFTQHDAVMKSGAMLNELQEIQLCKATHILVSTLTEEDHQKRVSDILHIWRILRMSRVACPVTYNSATPATIHQRPVDGLLGEELRLDSDLLAATVATLDHVHRIPREDLDLLDLANETGTKTLTVLFLVVIAERSLMRGDKNEISFKVSVYGSRLLQQCYGADPRVTYAVLRKAYRIRSAFAHDGAVDHDDLQDLLPQLYDCVTKIRLRTVLQPNLISVEKENLLFMGQPVISPDRLRSRLIFAL